MEKRTCTKCNIEKNIDEFSWRSERLNLKASECKICHKETRNAYYVENRKTEKARVMDRKHELSTWLQEYKKSLKCELCKEDEACCLEFHHTNPNEKEIGISLCANHGWSIERTKKEIAKCRVLCSNCHKKVHAGVTQ